MNPTETWDSLLQNLLSRRPAVRSAGTWPSVVTSVDMKLAYDARDDCFRPVILGDINANPEGIALVHDQNATNDALRQASEAYVSNIDGDGVDVVVFLPREVFSGEDESWRNEESWLTQDKRGLVEAISGLSRVNDVYLSSDGDYVEVENGKIQFKGREIDGYVNLNDTGGGVLEALHFDVEKISEGANAPTAVWTPSLNDTGKAGLLDALSELAERTPNVFVPKHGTIQDLEEARDFRALMDGGIVIKGPFGTYGDEVIAVGKTDDIARRIKQEEDRVKKKRGDTFSLFDWEDNVFDFSSWGTNTNYAVVEESITGTLQRDGRSLKIVDVKRGDRRYPIDFVPLVVHTDSTPTVPSILIRLSGKDNLNANLGAKYTQLVSLEQAFTTEISLPTGDGDELRVADQFVRVAGRSVQSSEVESAVRKGAYFAFAARNLSAFWAENSLDRR